MQPQLRITDLIQSLLTDDDSGPDDRICLFLWWKTISTKLCKAHPSTLSHLILRTNLRFKEQEALLSLLHTQKSGGSGNLSHAPSLLFSKRELRLMCRSFESSPLTTDVNYTTYIFIFILAQKSYLLSVSLDMEPYLPSAEHFEICLPKADDALWSP